MSLHDRVDRAIADGVMVVSIPNPRMAPHTYLVTINGVGVHYISIVDINIIEFLTTNPFSISILERELTKVGY